MKARKPLFRIPLWHESTGAGKVFLLAVMALRIAGLAVFWRAIAAVFQVIDWRFSFDHAGCILVMTYGFLVFADDTVLKIYFPRLSLGSGSPPWESEFEEENPGPKEPKS